MSALAPPAAAPGAPAAARLVSPETTRSVETPTTRAARAGHLHQIDVFRVVTFTAVIGVHALTAVTPADGLAGNAALALLHYTREGFFFLTAFVLFHTYAERPLRPGPFWRRRFLLVGVPYVVWSVLYSLPEMLRASSVPTAGRLLLGHLLRGDAQYHLYFLLVSLQVYLLMPLLLRLVRRARRHHVALLVVSGVLQLLTDRFLEAGSTTGVIGAVRAHAFVLAPTYQFWILLGAVAAVHRPALERLVRRRGRVLAVGVLLVAGLTELWFVLASQTGDSPAGHAGVFSAALLPWFGAAILGVYLVGVRWADSPGRPWAALVRFGSFASFGIYLVHPAVLGWILPHLPAWPTALVAVVAVVVTAVVSAGLVAVVQRTPLSLALCGRPWQRRLTRP